MPSEFHIHVNAIAFGAATMAALVELGFAKKPFSNSRPFASQFTPVAHLSFQAGEAAIFRSTFRQAKGILEKDNTAVAYMEGEFVLREQLLNYNCGYQG
jgi:hypothetical protein